MDYILPPQKNWEEFQNLCHDLWRALWNDPYTQHNGRQGHKQDGVDIFGYPYYAKEYHGVQCKERNANYSSKLTKKDIDDECLAAKKGFKPRLESLVVATTSPRDPDMQEYCRLLTRSQSYPFKVSVWSWDDIGEEIIYRPEIMDRYYPTVKIDELPDCIVLDITFIEDKIHAFFSRPSMKRAVSCDYRQFLFTIVSELADNAFSKGKATSVKVEFKESSLIIVDNGVPFNPQELLYIKGQGGSYTLKKLQKLFGDGLKLNYSYYDEKNEFIMSFPSGVLSSLLNEEYKITLNDTRFFGRTFAHQLALQQFSSIPTEKKKIKILVDTEYGLAMSNASEYFKTALKTLREGQSIEVLYTDNSGDAEYLANMFEGRPISFKSW